MAMSFLRPLPGVIPHCGFQRAGLVSTVRKKMDGEGEEEEAAKSEEALRHCMLTRAAANLQLATFMAMPTDMVPE